LCGTAAPGCVLAPVRQSAAAKPPSHAPSSPQRFLCVGCSRFSVLFSSERPDFSPRFSLECGSLSSRFGLRNLWFRFRLRSSLPLAPPWRVPCLNELKIVQRPRGSDRFTSAEERTLWSCPFRSQVNGTLKPPYLALEVHNVLPSLLVGLYVRHGR